MRTLDRGLPPSAYRDYIASPAWALKREQWKAHRSSSRRRCRACGSTHYQLHHRTYVRLGCERYRDLVPLCARHHTALGRLQARTGWSVETTTRAYLVWAGFRMAAITLLTTPAGWVVLALLAILTLR